MFQRLLTPRRETPHPSGWVTRNAMTEMGTQRRDDPSTSDSDDDRPVRELRATWPSREAIDFGS